MPTFVFVANEGCASCRRLRLRRSGVEEGEILDCSHSPTNLSIDASPFSKDVAHSPGWPSERLTSTPSRSHCIKGTQAAANSYNPQDGCYTGHVQHKDGSLLGMSTLLNLSVSFEIFCF